MSDWNNLLQKLNTRVNDPNQKVDDSASQLNFLQQNFSVGRSNGASPEIRSQSNEANTYPREDLSASTKSENILPTAVISYIDEMSDLRINDIKNFKPEEREARTLAVNSRFICYTNESGVLIIKSLKNLSLIHPLPEIDSKVVDLAFFEAPVSNYLALICANGTLIVFSIDLNHSKDKILVKYRLKHSYKQPTEKAQIQWKNEEKIGVIVGQELTVFDIIPDKPNPEPTEEPPKPISQNNFEFGVNIRDFAFSPAYPLAYILLENNTVRIISLENVDEMKHFTPHDASAGPVLKILAYKSLVRHQAIKSNEEGAPQSNDQTFRDIFLTVTQSFELKVWDLSEWDSEDETYYCIETYQLNQNNDKLDPITLIDRFVFYDPGLNFVFIGFKTNGEKGICITALHIEQFFYGYSESYDSAKKSRKFVNSIQTVWLKKNDLTDISVLNFGDDEIDSYFKKNTYVQMSDFEPASTRTQDGSHACNSKSVLVFFVHNEDAISLYKVLGDKLYPFALVEEFDKITQAEQLETQSAISKSETSDSSFPPEIPTFLQELINENKKKDKRKEEDKLVKVFAEPEYGKDIKQDEVVETKKGSKEHATKDDTNSPDTTKVQPSHKKKHEHKKDREAESHDQGKKVVPTKIVMRTDNQKNPPIQAAGLKSLETLEKEMQASKKEEAYSQSIEKAIEKKFQELTDRSLQALSTRFNKLEETIESRVNERVSKLQLDSLNNTLSKDIDDRIQREFTNGFEKVVTPCFERYLVKMFEQVCSSFDRGHKYYIEKLNVEQAKGEQLKETMNEVIKSFIQISNALTEGLMNNQNSFSRMENNVQDKQNQISRLVDQMNEILQKQQEVQKKIDSIERDMQDALNQYQSEVEVYRDMANRYLDRLTEFPSGTETKAPEEGKKDTQAPGTYPPFGFGNNPYYGKPKEKTPHPLNDQLAYLQGIATGRPMDVSGGPMFRGIGMSPASSQMLNPMYPQAYDYYNNPYQKAKANYYANLQNQQTAMSQQQGINPVLNQQNMPQNMAQNMPPPNNMPIYNPSPSLNPHNPTPVSQQTPMSNQTNQLPPELQALYQKLDMFLKQTSGDKEEEKGANLSSPYMPNVGPQDENKKFFGGMNQAQVQSSTPQQGPSSQRSLSQIEPPQHQKMSNISSQNQSFSQDPESAGKPGGQHLPPGMQGTPQPQPNFVQALLQNLPQLQQNLTQNQNMNQPKLPPNFSHNIQGQGAGTPSNQGQQNVNQLGNQMGWGQNMNFQSMFPQNIAPPPNLGNFGGYQAFPPQMANATINKMSGSKPTSTVDISQIPLVNSMFKTPSRDAMADENNNTATESNENVSE